MLVIDILLDGPLLLQFLLLIWTQRYICCTTSHASDVSLGHYAVLNYRVANPDRLLLEGDLWAWGNGCIACDSWSVLSLRLVIEESFLDRLASWRIKRRLLIYIPSVELLRLPLRESRSSELILRSEVNWLQVLRASH